MSVIDLTNAPVTQKIAVVNADGTALAQPSGTAQSPSGAVQSVQGVDNSDVTLLASAARTVTTASADQTNYACRGVKVVLDMTVVGTGSVTMTIQGKDAVSGKYYTLLAGAAVTTNSTNVYTVFPGATASANVAANDILPRTWRVNVVANNANSATYSLGASVIV